MEYTYLADREEVIPEIARWYFTEWGHKLVENSAEELDQRLRQFLNCNNIPLMMLAIDNDILMGVAQLKYFEMDIYPEKKHWLGGVFIPPQYRGNRIGANLVNQICKLAQSLGVRTLYLQTERLDGGLYRHLDWIPVEQVEYKGADVLVMEKQLKA